LKGRLKEAGGVVKGRFRDTEGTLEDYFSNARRFLDCLETQGARFSKQFWNKKMTILN
jgi:hypothetical protein